MKRSEAREHIFKMVFGLEFNGAGELPQQLELYFEQLGEADEKDRTYIEDKARAVAEHREEIEQLIAQKTGKKMEVDVRRVEAGRRFEDSFVDIEKLIHMDITIED